MNLPNKLTMLRVFMIPFFVLFMLTNIGGNYGNYLACAIFIVASFTDLLDGYIARKYKLVTNFGKFMDPLADKLLVCAALICLTYIQILPAWIVIIIISREFIISGFRLIASDNGVVIAAGFWGKFKTASQMVMVVLLLINSNLPIMNTAETVFIYLALILTVISLIDYLIKNIHVLKEGSNK